MKQLISKHISKDEAVEYADVRETVDLLDQGIIQYDNSAKKNQKEFQDGVRKSIYLKNDGEKLSIKGSKNVIEAFNEISKNKYDNIVELKDLGTIEFFRGSNNSKYEVKLNVLSNDGSKEISTTAETIYDGSENFLDKLFKINKFASFSLGIDGEEMIKDNIEFVKSKKPDTSFRFRFIEDKDKVYLRAVVTKDRYKLYDNNIILYIALVIIENYSLSNNSKFYVDNFHISDSKLYLSLLSSNPIKLGKGISIDTGIQISNSEISDGSVKFNFIYKINNGRHQFSVLRDEVLKIDHGWRTGKIEDELSKINDLSELTNGVIKAINIVKLTSKPTNSVLFAIFDNLSKSRSKTLTSYKGSFESLRNSEEIVNNTVSLLDLFCKVDQIIDDDDIDAKTFISSKFNYFIEHFAKK